MIDIQMWASIAAVVGVIIAVWQFKSTNNKERDTLRDEITAWKTQADIKLETIDVAWKPAVNNSISSLDNRMLNLETQLLNNISAVVDKLEKTNELLTDMNGNLRVFDHRITRLEADVEKHTDRKVT